MDLYLGLVLAFGVSIAVAAAMLLLVIFFGCVSINVSNSVSTEFLLERKRF